MMNRNDNGISVATPPAIHVGPIVTPGSNETISIVIPLSAQLATVSGQKPAEKSCEDYYKDVKPQMINGNTSRPRNDKTKGCPFPTCIRYGRAFSRAHDLKRHIARHELRKEKLSDIIRQEAETSVNSGEHLSDNIVLQRDRHQGVKMEDSQEVDKLFSCPHCKKRYAQESKLKTHLASHEKIPFKNVCPLCGTHFQNDDEAQKHMKEHTASILQAQALLGKADISFQKVNKDDSFPLEEILLLSKSLCRSNDKTGAGGSSKIRCDYCSKTFKTKWTLSSHVAAHEGRFQFDCGQCGKKFVRKSHYEGHVRTHEAARPYVCDQCGKTFKELKHRREHTKRKHPVNHNAIQNILESINPCASEELPIDQAKFTLLMPVNFTA